MKISPLDAPVTHRGADARHGRSHFERRSHWTRPLAVKLAWPIGERAVSHLPTLSHKTRPARAQKRPRRMNTVRIQAGNSD